jgi:hypothetical protein
MNRFGNSNGSAPATCNQQQRVRRRTRLYFCYHEPPMGLVLVDGNGDFCGDIETVSLTAFFGVYYATLMCLVPALQTWLSRRVGPTRSVGSKADYGKSVINVE